MHTVAKISCLLLLLGGCAVAPPLPGESQAAVTARLGQPTALYPAPPGQVLEYASGPMGQSTWMATFGANGRLVRFEQVLTGPVFASLKIGVATKADVLRTIGRPAERSRVALNDYEVWSYRYKEHGAWNSMMHVHFDQAGIVRMMLNGPDPMYEERRGFR